MITYEYNTDFDNLIRVLASALVLFLIFKPFKKG